MPNARPITHAQRDTARETKTFFFFFFSSSSFFFLCRRMARRVVGPRRAVAERVRRLRGATDASATGKHGECYFVAVKEPSRIGKKKMIFLSSFALLNLRVSRQV
jgi:hypothetical protein